MDFDETGKLPGKTQYSGRRRPVTRKSGFSSHPDTTGGEFKVASVAPFVVSSQQSLVLRFVLPSHQIGDLVGFGVWFSAPPSVEVKLHGIGKRRYIITSPCQPDWSKVGSIWQSDGDIDTVSVAFVSHEDCRIAIWEPTCGTIGHKYLNEARPVLLKNMYQFAPEANFIELQGKITVNLSTYGNNPIDLYLKSCNRCARFLPINVSDERKHLSFSNHCVAEHRLPCKHTGFGRLTNVDQDVAPKQLQLVHGYQLECRFCKKFEVNAAHNPQRTAAQMKEDAARRRAFELLLMELYGGSPQLLYRHRFGRELTDDIWEKFGRKCFNCEIALDAPNKMHLDHTRPLALLWPLDETATCLCKDCNSLKRDRPPVQFYTECSDPKKLDTKSV